MKLSEIYSHRDFEVNAGAFLARKPVISLEIFPPKGNKEELHTKNNQLFEELKQLIKFKPSFISVTYGAGGSTRDRTLDLILRIKNELNIEPMPHFTCVGANREEIKNYIKIIEEHGINNILALRGDPPKGETEFKKTENGFQYAYELVEFIKSQTNLSIGVAGYPEKHPECTSLNVDIENLKRKVEAGADVIITQVFYNNSHFFHFLGKVRALDINVPVIPGILPITNLNQVEKMANMCGTEIPKSLVNRLKEHQNQPEVIKELGIEFAIYQCQQLLDAGVPGLHFYTLNKAYATKSVLESLSVEF